MLQTEHLVLSVVLGVLQFDAGVTQLRPLYWTTPEEHAVQTPFPQEVHFESSAVQFIQVHDPFVLRE